MNLSKWSLANSKLIYFFIAILVCGGLYSYYDMSKLEDPTIKIKQAVVVTVFPGGSPHEVELQVTDRLEKAIREMKGIDFTDSQSSANLSMITVNLEKTIPNEEVEQYWDILRRKVSDSQSKLPSSASSSVVLDSYGDVFGMFYALTSDGYTNEELAGYAELIKSEIQRIKGVSKIELYGIAEPTIEILLNESQLANMGVAPLSVIQTIKGHNQTVYSGYYSSGDQRIRVAIDDKLESVENIENIIIQGLGKDQFRLKDIATVKKSYAAPTRNSLSYDGKQAIGISISALEGTDILKIGDKVEEKLEYLQENRLPLGIEYDKVFFQPERVKEAVHSFIYNLIASILIVIVVLMAAMGIRSGILLGTTLLVTVIGSVLFLSIFDGTLQRVSLAAFILAMGMLVDNAIVIVDGILIDMKKGRLRSKALTDIGKKTAMPLLGATIIAILAFLPMFLSPDTTGIYVRDLFVVLAVSLLLSWVLSLVMVPLQAKVILKYPKKESVKGDKNIFQKSLRSVLSWTLANRTITVSIAVLSVVASYFMYQKLPQSFFPDLNYNQLYIEYKLPESSSSEHTERDLEEITAYLLAQEHITHVTSSVGATPSRYNLVRSIATPALSYGDLIVDFTDKDILVESIPAIQRYLTDNYPQAYVRVKRYNLMYSKYPIEVTFTGSDPEILRGLTLQAQEIMRGSDKIMLITSDWERKVPVLEVEYNQSVARELGLTRQDIGISLLASTEGMPTDKIYEGADSRGIILRCVDSNGNKIETLETSPVFSMIPSVNGLNKETLYSLMNGSLSEEDFIANTLATTPLREAISDIKLKWEDPKIIRHDGQRAMRAQGNNIPSTSAEEARSEIKEQMEALELPEGYEMKWQGEYETKNNSITYLIKNIPLAIVLIIGILIFLFKDYKKPIIILLCSPLLCFGAVLGVRVSGLDFGFVAICGILGLIGMMIKNGIVLMDEINIKIKAGKRPYVAILDSAESRFRPVMMASLTTILGMIPLLPDAMFGSLAATIMGGLFVGTLVTLIFIPVLYSIFFNIKNK